MTKNEATGIVVKRIRIDNENNNLCDYFCPFFRIKNSTLCQCRLDGICIEDTGEPYSSERTETCKALFKED